MEMYNKLEGMVEYMLAFALIHYIKKRIDEIYISICIDQLYKKNRK